MKKEGILLTLLFVFSLVLSMSAYSIEDSSVFINEVMPNPFDNCSDCTEWLELYSNTSQNLTDWKLNTGESKNLSINATIQDYLIITKNKTRFLDYWSFPSEKIIELAIGLTNGGDSIKLYNSQNETVDSFNWSKDIGNSSWSKIDNSSFVECSNLTPTSRNSCQNQEQGNESENKSPPSPPQMLVFWPQQIWNNKTNFTISLSLINFSQGFYDLKIDIKNATKYLNRFWTQDGWSDKNAWVDNATEINNSNSSQNITSIIDIDEFFTGNALLQIKIRNSTNEYDSPSYNITILNGTLETQNQAQNNSQDDSDDNPNEESSSIDIKNFPDTAKFGDTITIDVKIYRGNTGKYAVYAYVQDLDNNKVSNKKTIHIDERYATYRNDIKLTLECLNESGTYKIVVEGLDERDTQSIDISSCLGTDNSQTNLNTAQNETITHTADPAPITSNIPLTGQATASTPKTQTSQTLKSPSLSFLGILPYILLVIIAAIIIYIIIKR